MRILPTPAQRKYLDELTTLAHAPRKSAKATPESKLPPSPPKLTPRKDGPLAPRKDGPAWLDLLPRPLVDRLSTCQAMLSRVPPIVILGVVLFVLFGLSRAFGHEVQPPLGEQLQIERAGSPQPMPIESVIVAPTSPAPTVTGGHERQFPLAVLIMLGAPPFGLLTLLLWIGARRRRLQRRLPPRTLHVAAGQLKPSGGAAVADKVRDDEAGQAAALGAADMLAARAPDAWLLGLATHRGLVRSRNEDAGCAFAVGTHQVLVLADGVGGMPLGAEAARAAVRTAERAIRQAWHVTPDGQEPLPKMMLSSAFAAAAARLASMGLARGFACAAAGLRTTLIIVIGAADRFHFGYIGDGEINLVRGDGSVKFLSVPHKADPQVQNVLSASLGPVPQGTAEFGVMERRRSDVLVAATDGVTDRVAPAFYARTLLRQAGRHRGDLTRTAESVLEQLSRHRDENGLFAFDDNMTLGLMGDGSAPIAPAQALVTLAASEVA